MYTSVNPFTLTVKKFIRHMAADKQEFATNQKTSYK